MTLLGDCTAVDAGRRRELALRCCELLGAALPPHWRSSSAPGADQVPLSERILFLVKSGPQFEATLNALQLEPINLAQRCEQILF